MVAFLLCVVSLVQADASADENFNNLQQRYERVMQILKQDKNDKAALAELKAIKKIICMQESYLQSIPAPEQDLFWCVIFGLFVVNALQYREFPLISGLGLAYNASWFLCDVLRYHQKDQIVQERIRLDSLKINVSEALSA